MCLWRDPRAALVFHPASIFEAATATMLLCVHASSNSNCKHSYQFSKWNLGQTLVCVRYTVKRKPVCTHQCRSLYLNRKTIQAPLELQRTRPHGAQVKTTCCYTWRPQTWVACWLLFGILFFTSTPVRNKAGQTIPLCAAIICLH